MSFLKDLKEKSQNWNLMWVFLILGLISLVSSFIWIDENNVLFKIGYTLGTTFIASGVFAAIAKSNQFAEIFSKILRDIIYAQEHLEKRNDLEVIWENVTRVLSKKKFSKISDQMHKNIKKYYLPLDHDYYYDDYCIELVLEYDDDNKDYLVVKESTSFNIVCEDEKLKIKNMFQCFIKLDMTNKDETQYDLKKLTFNNNNFEGKIIKTVDGNKLCMKYEKELTGRKIHSVKRNDEKRFNVKYNPVKSHMAVWIYNNLKIDITYPKEMNIEVRPLGLLNDLVDEDKNTKFNNRKVIEYKGLIYKNQGVFLMLNK